MRVCEYCYCTDVRRRKRIYRHEGERVDKPGEKMKRKVADCPRRSAAGSRLIYNGDRKFRFTRGRERVPRYYYLGRKRRFRLVRQTF